ncbi:MAG TPA: SDR family NAD(P)-dependent oxidoreductase [Solirubrobacterales bacterium]|nr:SDR family NAD(P)-dependent oxidoreductase [Solirubrobacterales bacterium]
MVPFPRRLRRAALRPAGALFRVASKPVGGGAGMTHAALGPLAADSDVAGTVVLVTGASSGIGEATARRLVAAGATVLLVARSADRLERIAFELEGGPGEAVPHPCDLSDLDAIDALCAHALANHGAVDVLVNNAGRSIRRSVDQSGDRFHDFQRTMQLNYFGAIRLILGLLPAMRARGHGQVVNVSSAGVQIRTPRFSGYIASKAALEAFSDAVQAETLGDGIRFTTISMPLVRTPMISPTPQYEGIPALTPEEAARLVAEAIAGRPRRVAPPFAHVFATIDRLSPEAMDAVRARVYRMFPE